MIGQPFFRSLRFDHDADWKSPDANIYITLSSSSWTEELKRLVPMK